MSVDSFSLPDSSNKHPFCPKHLWNQPIWQRHVVNDSDADSSAPSPSIALLSGDFFVASINVAEYLDKFCPFPIARRLATMHQNGDKRDFVHAHYGRWHDTALQT